MHSDDPNRDPAEMVHRRFGLPVTSASLIPAVLRGVHLLQYLRSDAQFCNRVI
jgi:hypothetical protein